MQRRFVKPLPHLEMHPDLYQSIRHVNIAGHAPGIYTPNLSCSTQLRSEVHHLALSETVLDSLFTVIYKTPTHAELALLLLKTPNLATLRVYADRSALERPDRIEDGQLPPWLATVLPVISMMPNSSVPMNEFCQLHTLELSMGCHFSLDLAGLFYIPSL